MGKPKPQTRQKPAVLLSQDAMAAAGPSPLPVLPSWGLTPTPWEGSLLLGPHPTMSDDNETRVSPLTPPRPHWLPSRGWPAP